MASRDLSSPNTRRQSSEDIKLLREEQPIGDIEDSLRLIRKQNRSKQLADKEKSNEDQREDGRDKEDDKDQDRSRILQTSLDEIQEDAMDLMADDETSRFDGQMNYHHRRSSSSIYTNKTLKNYKYHTGTQTNRAMSSQLRYLPV